MDLIVQKGIPNLERKMRAILPGEIMKLLKNIGKSVDARGYSSFVVGGFVRDVILGINNFDLDIVLEGNAIKFGKALSEELAGTLVAYKKFGTATVFIDWPRGVKKPDSAGPKFKIDLATTRVERYEKPAALPTVQFSSLKNDLARRDFTINAMAISLNKNTFGQLIDLFNGLEGIKNKRIRVLHDGSFIDDPTRIFRAVRFEQRFSFKIDHFTEKLIKNAVKEKMFDRTQNQRIRDEIILILKEKLPFNALIRMKELHELRFIHKKIVLNKRIKSLFKLCLEAYTWYSRSYSKKGKVDLYSIYLMALCDSLDIDQVNELCEKFTFKKKDKLNLICYKKNSRRIIQTLSSRKVLFPSRIYRVLERIPYEVILMILARANNIKAKRAIKAFLKKYDDMSIKIRGDDLKRAGLKEGPQFKKILREILYLRLDGKIKSGKDEMLYLRKITVKGRGYLNRDSQNSLSPKGRGKGKR